MPSGTTSETANRFGAGRRRTNHRWAHAGVITHPAEEPGGSRRSVTQRRPASRVGNVCTAGQLDFQEDDRNAVSPCT